MSDAPPSDTPTTDGPPTKKQKIMWNQVTDNEDGQGRPALVTFLQKRTATKNAMSKDAAETEALNWDAIKFTHPDTGEVKWGWRKEGSKKTEMSTRSVAGKVSRDRATPPPNVHVADRRLRLVLRRSG